MCIKKLFVYLVVWDAKSPRLGSSFIWPWVRAYSRWSNMMGTQVIGSNGSQGEGLGGSGSLLCSFHRDWWASQENDQNSPLGSVLWWLQSKRHSFPANKAPTCWLWCLPCETCPSCPSPLSDPSGKCHSWTGDMFSCLTLLTVSLLPTIIFAPRRALWLLLITAES